jgi:uncharacterized membrane protein
VDAKYNLFAGGSLERLAARSDGLFAVAMTLLVLDVRVPEVGELTTRLIPWVMSFMTLGIFWVGQQTQLNLLERSDRHLSWIHLAFLLAVSLTPFSTALLAQFITFRVALLLYWLNVLILGAILYAGWRYARHAGLVNSEVTGATSAAVERRIAVAQVLYALGAAACVLSTYVSIAIIVLVQLNYAVAPRIRGLDRP